MFCDETIPYVVQTDGTEFKCYVSEITRFVGILLYFAVIHAWAPNLKLKYIPNALLRTRFEKIKN